MAFSDMLVTDTFVRNYMGLPILSTTGQNKLLTFYMVYNSDYDGIVTDTSNDPYKIIKVSDLCKNSTRYPYLNYVRLTHGGDNDQNIHFLEVRSIQDYYNLKSTMDTEDQVNININLSFNEYSVNFVLDSGYVVGDTIPGTVTGAGGTGSPVLTVSVDIRYKNGLQGINRDFATACIGDVGSVYQDGAGGIVILTNSWGYYLDFGECQLSDYVVIR